MQMLGMPNPHKKPNSDVIKPWLNAHDMKYRPFGRFIIDFGNMKEAEAALYEAPFEHLRYMVKPSRDKNTDMARKENWWRLGRSGEGLMKAKANLSRLLITGRVGKHRVFTWVTADTVPDCEIVAIAREDDYFFGVLHSQAHETWARAQGTQVRDAKSGFRYTPKSTFDTFPFPWPPGTEPSENEDPRVKAIADAARELVRLRDNWLNPKPAPGEPPISEADLKDRTLTKLYNLRAAGKCAWLENAHRVLDEAVFAAYGWPADLTTQQILASLLALNHKRAAAESSAKEPPKTPSTQLSRVPHSWRKAT
jgi:type II restriction/modification system DNA methylase subunit YeeA